MAVAIIVAAGLAVSGCDLPWSTDYGPTYSKPTSTGSPVVTLDDVVEALEDQDFKVDDAGASMHFGLKHNTEVWLSLGKSHKAAQKQIDAEGRAGSSGNSRAVCNVSVSVYREEEMRAPDQAGRKPSKAAQVALSAIEKTLGPHCKNGENLTPAQLAEAVWGSGLDFEVRMQAGAQVFPPALEIGAGGGYGEADDGWSVGARIYENDTAANEAMEQQQKEDDYQSEPDTGFQNPDVFELFIGSHYQACNVMISFGAQLGDGPGENPYVKRARKVRDRAEDVAKSLSEDCDE